MQQARTELIRLGRQLVHRETSTQPVNRGTRRLDNMMDTSAGHEGSLGNGNNTSTGLPGMEYSCLVNDIELNSEVKVALSNSESNSNDSSDTGRSSI